MPMMLDNTMPMDMDEDLFGEGAADVMGSLMPLRPQNKHLRQRLDEMRSRGCCQAVSWSRTGTIASISADGTALELRHLRAHPKDGSWDLSDPVNSPLVQGTRSNPLVHLEWAATNSPELAIFDSVGRVAIISFAISLNNAFPMRSWEPDPIDDLNAVAGCYWLPVAPPQPQKPFNILHGPAVKAGTGYQYTSSFVHLNTMTHPHTSRTALFCVTTGGMLKMLWWQNNNTYQETTNELESVHSSDDLVTHAAVTSDKAHVLVAVATSSKRLRLHRVDVQWGNAGGQEKSNMPSVTGRLNPSLNNKQLASTSWSQSGPSNMSIDYTMTELSSLTVLPSSLDSSGTNTVPAMILAVRSSLPSPGAFGDGQTVVDRWEVLEQRETLHPAFEQLGSRRNSVSSNELPMVTKLHKLEPLVLNKILIRVQTMHFGRTLIFNFSDGTAEYRDRFTFEEIYGTEDFNQISHLRQVGWEFPEGNTCCQIAYSPTHCSMISLGDEGKPKWIKLQYTKGDIGDSMQDATYGACVAGLTVSAASAMWYQSNVDDLLALVAPYTHKKKFNLDWVGELIRILKVQIDYTDIDQPHDNLIRNAVLQSCLSIMHSIGFRGRLKPQSFCGKLAMINLNVRNANLLITMAINPPPPLREKTNPLDEDEVVTILGECARWALDLLAWLADCLFELMNNEDFMSLVEQQRSADMLQYLMERNDIALHLVLCSSSRNLLSALCRRMLTVESISNKAHEHYQQQRAKAMEAGRSQNIPLQEAYAKMKRITDSSMINLKSMEKLLHTFATDIKHTYADFLPRVVKNQPNPPQGKEIDNRVRSAQSQCELAMLHCTPPPAPFFPTIRKFLDKDLRAFRSDTDAARLYFANYDLLEVLDDENSLAAKGAKGLNVDVFKKLDLGPKPGHGKQWRRCARCSAVMEDVSGHGRAGLTFLLNQQRKCPCGGFWSLMPPGKLVL